MHQQTKKEKEIIQQHFDDLLKSCLRSNKKDQELITKAFKFANEAHKGIRRRSGEPYICHPLSVATIVTNELGLGTKSVISSLLHDIVEDTDYTIEDIEHLFNKKVATIVDGLTKLSNIFDTSTSIQAENFRKLILTLSDDVRVILIKLADRLHNMRTLSSMPANKQLKIAGETMFLYAPLAHRLGLYAIKTELEDLSLKYRQPEIFKEIKNKINQSEEKRNFIINKFSLPIINKLTEQGFNFNINGRSKSIFSIWQKMQTKNIPFEEVYDQFAIRIIFQPDEGEDEKTKCWNIYSTITDIYIPRPDRIRDWISKPKANGYEALHATVMGPTGQWVEVQIRSKRMDEIAERGYAAHWKYKGINSKETELDNWIKKIRELLENPQSDALEFLDEFKLNLFTSEIIVFTPKGQTKQLPKRITALDFAYDVHTEIGNNAIGAKVNHKLVSLNHVLKSGDQVEIITSEKQHPQREWENFVTTAKAKHAIKSAFKEERKKNILKGKKILNKKLKELKLRPTANIYKKLFLYYSTENKDSLYNKIGIQNIDIKKLKKILSKKSKNKFIRYWQLQLIRSSNRKLIEKEKNQKKHGINIDKKKPLIISDDFEEKTFKIAKCCNPIPGDDIIGYQSDKNTIIIHKTNCPNAIKLNSSFGNKIVKAKWTTHKALSFLARIKIDGFDKVGLVNKITEIISKDLNVNMRAINFESHDGVFEGHIDLYVHNTTDLNNMIMNLIKIKGIDSVKRIEVNE